MLIKDIKAGQEVLIVGSEILDYEDPALLPYQECVGHVCKVYATLSDPDFIMVDTPDEESKLAFHLDEVEPLFDGPKK